jgi:hypothetical protein
VNNTVVIRSRGSSTTSAPSAPVRETVHGHLVVSGQRKLGGRAWVNEKLVELAHQVERGELKPDPANAALLRSLLEGGASHDLARNYRGAPKFNVRRNSSMISERAREAAA